VHEGKRSCTGACQTPAKDSLMDKSMQWKMHEREKCEAEGECPLPRDFKWFTPCENGTAGEYPCNDVDLSP